jgi:hypothetical protein
MKGKLREYKAENMVDVFTIDRADRPFNCTGTNLYGRPPVYPDRT